MKKNTVKINKANAAKLLNDVSDNSNWQLEIKELLENELNNNKDSKVNLHGLTLEFDIDFKKNYKESDELKKLEMLENYYEQFESTTNEYMTQKLHFEKDQRTEILSRASLGEVYKSSFESLNEIFEELDKLRASNKIDNSKSANPKFDKNLKLGLEIDELKNLGIDSKKLNTIASMFATEDKLNDSFSVNFDLMYIIMCLIKEINELKQKIK